MGEHAIILVTASDRKRRWPRAPSSDALTQYILIDVSAAKLRSEMLGSELGWGLDIENQAQVDELFDTGRTETTGLVGMKNNVTIEWCACSAPASHRRRGVTQMG